MGNLGKILFLAFMLALWGGQNVLAAPKDSSATNDVNVVNTPSVIIDNTEAESIPVQVKEYNREPVRIAAAEFLSQGTASWDRVVYTVPLDKILVIERIDTTITSYNPDQKLWTNLIIFGGDDDTYDTGETKFAVSFITNNVFLFERGSYSNTGSENIRMYVGPGERLLFTNQRSFSDPPDNERSTVRIQGYLVPADSPSLAP